MTTIRAPGKIIPRAFPGIKPDEVQDIISHSRVTSYPCGAVLCVEGAMEQKFYMILDGDVEVTKVVNETETRLLKTLTAGEYFGEMSLIQNAPRAATVSAKTDVVVLELNKEGFDKIFENSPSVAISMVREISNRLRQNDEMAIGDLRKRADELEIAYEQLAEQDKIRREFLTNVAHELRTPLMSANGYLQFMQKGMLSGDQLQQAIDTVSRNVNTIANLVNDLLFLQEIELVLPEFTVVDINAIARGVAQSYKSKAETNKVNLQVKGEVPPVSGDSKSLERAVMALVDNAVKFSPRGGDVTVALKSNGTKVILSVTDQGIGIPTENLPRIFDRFYHTETSGGDLFGGLGLGLSITRQVIQQHHGTLDVESAPGRGTTFTISLNKNTV